MKSQRKIHPYAEIFPLTEGPPLWELSDRIKANGLREPIVLLGDEILDGRRRELACIRAGIEPTYRTFGSRSTDGFDALEFVIDTNLHRRHLGEGDRALAAARYAKAKVGRPAENKSCQVGTIILDTESSLPNIVDGSTENKSCQLGTIISDAPTNAEAAEKFDISEKTVDRAKVVIANGTPELQQALAADIVTVSDAAKVATEPPEVQNAALEEVKKGKSRSATRAAQKVKEKKAEEDKPKEEIDESPWVDAWGIPITKEASAAFANQCKFDELLSLLRKAQKLYKELAELPGGEYLQQPFVSANTRNGFVHNGLATCIMNVADCKPKYTICPYAYNPDFTHDNKCTLCKGLGWVCAVSKSNGPPESLIQAAKQAHGVQ